MWIWELLSNMLNLFIVALFYLIFRVKLSFLNLDVNLVSFDFNICQFLNNLIIGLQFFCRKIDLLIVSELLFQTLNLALCIL